VFLGRTARLFLMVERAEAGSLHYVLGPPVDSNHANVKYFLLNALRQGPAEHTLRQGTYSEGGEKDSPRVTGAELIPPQVCARCAAVLHIMHA